MNIAYIVSIAAILFLLIFMALSFFKSQDLKIQLWFVVVATFNVGILTSLILVNYSSKSALIWPALLLIFILNRVLEIKKHL